QGVGAAHEAGRHAERDRPAARAAEGDHRGPGAAAGQLRAPAADLRCLQALPGEVRHAGNRDREAPGTSQDAARNREGAAEGVRRLPRGADRGVAMKRPTSLTRQRRPFAGASGLWAYLSWRPVGIMRSTQASPEGGAGWDFSTVGSG